MVSNHVTHTVRSVERCTLFPVRRPNHLERLSILSECFHLQTLDAPTLQDVSLTLDANRLLAVIGPVGAGKVRGRAEVCEQLNSYQTQSLCPRSRRC